ncbi:hypothetical protein [Streptomyces sp. SPB074]|uniref:hypothetical protein n=1 Tax=Streptomyces sp. (strain SPB074) TaxID=465543 RepID=UPI00017FF3FF|nr:hypothetical protein [Streptomyces sp. SPB074]EFG65592.1 hypothetical protein SSBG_06418 [Streptomyces sp. SPB074]
MTDCHESTLSWLTEPARSPRAARLEMGYWGSARLPVGEAYAVISLPAAVVRAAVGSPSRAVERRRLHEVLAGGAIYRDEEAASYNALVATSARQTWDDEDATCAPAHELVRIPHPARTLASPTWCQSPPGPPVHWIVLNGPERVCAPGRISSLLALGRRRGATEVCDGEH